MPKDASGIANGRPGVPEQQGTFLSDGGEIDETRFSVRMGRGRIIDVWEVDVTDLTLEPGPDGWLLCRTRIEPSRLSLAETWETGSEPFDEGRRVFQATRW